MKPIILSINFLLCGIIIYAQPYQSLKLSDSLPVAGKYIDVHYDPSNSDLKSLDKIAGRVYFYNKGNKIGEQLLHFEKSEFAWKATLLIPDSTIVFYVLPSSPDGLQMDNNYKSGYLYPVFLNGKPAPFAYYRMSGFAEGIPVYPGNLKKDPGRALALVKKELELHPENEAAIRSEYLNLLANSPEMADKEILVRKVLAFKAEKESDLIMSHIYLSFFGSKPQADSLENLILQRFPDGDFVKNKKNAENSSNAKNKNDEQVLASVHNRHSLNKNYYKELPAQILNEPVAPMTLLDIKGNAVTIGAGDLKGKIIIIDFWATWCKPCIASFPAMQRVIDKYKDKPEVIFLFISTMEQESPLKKTTAFLKQYPYPFTFLMDEKMEGMNMYKAYSHYKVTNGIPYKIVLGKNGNVRFRSNGFSGDEEDFVNELSAMIELVREE